MRKIFFSLLTFLAVVSTAIAQQGAPAPQVVPNDPAVRVGVMPNGITYYIRHNDRNPQRANFHIFYKVGAIMEQDSQNGLAHFLEHMAFNGSKNFPDNELINYLESIGVRFGENLNAMTGPETTTYMVTNVPVVREGIIDSALLVLHDWAGFISLNHDDIDKERGVIREEWRQGNNAQRRILEKELPVIYNNSMYSKRNVIGNEEVLKSFDYQELKDFYHRWYRPDMQAFFIVGDIDVDQVEKKLLEVMADIPAPTSTVQGDMGVIEDNVEPLVSVATDPETNATNIRMIFRHQKLPYEMRNTVDAQFVDLINGLINTMLNARYDEISNKPNAPFMGAGGGLMPLVKDYDALLIGASAKDGESIKALQAVYVELLRAKKYGFTNSELERAKAVILNNINSEYENRMNRTNDSYVNDYMEHFGSNQPYPAADVKKDMMTQLLSMVSLDQINFFISQYVSDINRTITVSMPEKAGSVIPTQADVLASLAAVEAMEIEAYAEESINEPLISSKLKGSKVAKTTEGKYDSKIFKLKNGVNVVYKQTDFDGDKVIMRAFQNGGTSTIEDLADLYTINLYGEFAPRAGVSKFSATDLQKMMAGKNVSVRAAIDETSQGFSGNASLKDLETMMQLVYLSYVSPRFDAVDWQMFIDQYKAMMPNIKLSPDYIYADSTANTVYGHNLRQAILSEKMLDMVSVERLAATYKKLYSNANDMTFVIIGNIEESTLVPLVEKYLGSLPSNKKVTPAIGKNSAKMVNGLVDNEFTIKLETPKVDVTQINHGKLDYSLLNRQAANAIAYILEMRYLKSIREEKGGTYGVHVNIAMKKLPEPTFAVNIGFQTDNSKVDELVPILQEEIEYMMENGVAEEYLNKYKEFNIKKFNEDQTKNLSWLYYLMSYYKIGDDYYDGYVDRINSLNSDYISKMAKQMFGQNNIIKVIMRPSEN